MASDRWAEQDLVQGPKKGKRPVPRAMLLVIEQMLGHETDEDDLRLWSAILMAN